MPKESKSDLKKQIRSTKRLLEKKHQQLSATQLLDMNRKLTYLQNELNESEGKALEGKMCGRYKMVKFVEAKKVARGVKQLRSLICKKGGVFDEECLDDCTADAADTAADVDSGTGVAGVEKKVRKSEVQSELASTKSIEEDHFESETKYTSLTLPELYNQLTRQQQNQDYIRYYPRDFKYVSLWTVDPKSLRIVEEVRGFIAARLSEIREARKKGGKGSGEIELVVRKKDVFGERLMDDTVEEERDDFFM